jgi:hypothetical protein
MVWIGLHFFLSYLQRGSHVEPAAARQAPCDTMRIKERETTRLGRHSAAHGNPPASAPFARPHAGAAGRTPVVHVHTADAAPHVSLTIASTTMISSEMRHPIVKNNLCKFQTWKVLITQVEVVRFSVCLKFQT